MSDETPQISVSSDVRSWTFKKGSYHPLEVKAEHHSGLVWLPSGNIRGVEDVRKFREILDEIEAYLTGEIAIINDDPQSPSEPPGDQGGMIPRGFLSGGNEGPPEVVLPLSGPAAGLTLDPKAKLTPFRVPVPPPASREQRASKPPSIFKRFWTGLKFFFIEDGGYAVSHWVI